MGNYTSCELPRARSSGKVVSSESTQTGRSGPGGGSRGSRRGPLWELETGAEGATRRVSAFIDAAMARGTCTRSSGEDHESHSVL